MPRLQRLTNVRIEMAQRIVHYVGGPLDGLAGLMEGNRHLFMISLDADIDGYYVMEY
jgi:hypothetical protein